MSAPTPPALCLKSGNAVILRGGSDSRRSARAIHAAMRDGLRAAGIARRGGAGAAGGRPRLCRRHARRRRADRPDRPARRQKRWWSRVQARGAGAGARARRGAVPHLCPRRRRPGHGAARARTTQNAPHRHLRRHRDAADRRRHRAGAAAAAGRRSARAAAARSAPMRAARAIVPRPAGRARCRISTPNGSMPCCRSPWSMASRRRSRISAATAASTPTPSSPRTPRRPKISWPASTARSACGTPRRSSATAASSASAPRSASPPAASMRAARSGWSS